MSLLNQQIKSQILLTFVIVAADTISKYNQIRQGFDNNKFNQNITNIHLDDMFTNGLREMKEYNKSLIKVIVQYIIAIL